MAVAYALRNEGKRLESVAISDSFGQSAQTHEELLELYGLTEEDIVRQVNTALGRQ